MVRRLHSIVLLFVLLLGCAGMNYVQAAVYNGNCGANGSNVKWSLNTSTGVLSITGSGAMANYLSTDGTNTDISTAPWYNYRSSITTITIQSGVTTIGNNAFRAAAVQQVTIPSTITTIGEYAFFNTSYLKNISVPSSVTSIGAYAYGYAGRSTTENQTLSIYNSVTSMGRGAFFKCSRLVTVTMGTGVKAIPQDCFYECTALQTITLPSALKTIGESAFNGCTALKTVSFPSTLTTIGPYAFKQIGNATTVNQTISIPNSVTSMGRGAFFKCARLKTITFGTGVKAVPQDCCYQSTNLQTISFSSTLTSIGESAFNGCTALTTVEFPATLTTFSPNTFLNCTALANIYVNWTSNIPTWNTVTNNSGITLHVPCGTKALYQAATGWKNYTIAGVTTLQTVTCTCGTGGKVKIDNGTAGTNVTKQASCDANVKLTATASTGYHFVQWNDGNTTNPRTVLVAGAKTYTASFTKNQYTLTVKTATNNTTQGTVKISNGTTGASATATIVHGASTTITATPATGYHFVQWNDGNTTNPRSITMTGNATYTATFAINTYTLTAKINNSSYGKVKIDNGTANATVSKTVNHGASVTLTAVTTTSNCNIDFLQWNDGVKDNPRTVTVDAAITYTAQFGTIGGNCGANGNNLTWSFNRCTGVLTISGSGAMAGYAVNDVPWAAFRDAITSVVLPNGLTNIGSNAFNRCTQITSITIPSNVTEIGITSFYGCTKLTYVGIPSSVTTIKTGAFQDCTSLTTIIIPNSVTSIGSQAFYGTSSLTSICVFWTENIPKWTSMTNKSGITLYVPCGTKSLYKSTTGWKNYTVVDTPSGTCGAQGDNITWTYCDGVLTISGTGEMKDWSSESAVPWYAYKDAIRSVVINEGVTRIGSYAFKYCNKIVNVSIPSSTTSIGIWAFDQCTGVEGLHISDLTAWCTVQFESFASNPLYYAAKPDLYVNDELIVNLVIPEGVTSIYKHAFQHCSAQTITLPEGLQIIGEGNASAFAYTTISSITIPQSVTYLGRWSFTDNDNLTDIYVYWTENIPAWNNMTNKSPQSNITLHVPCGTESLYQAANGWKDYTIEADIPNVKSGTYGPDNIEWTFDYCDSLLTITGNGELLCDQNTWGPNAGGINPNAVKSVFIGKGVTYLGIYTLSYMTNIEYIEIEEGHPTHRTGCNAIIRIGSEQEGDTLIFGCPHTVIPTTCTTIRGYGFSDNHRVTEMTIPSSVKQIANMQGPLWQGNNGQVFYTSNSASEGLKDLYVEWTKLEDIPAVPNNRLGDMTKVRLHVPCGTTSLYKQVTGWSKFKEYIEESSTFTITVQSADPTMGDVSIIVN